MMKPGTFAYTIPRSRGVRDHEPRPEALEPGEAAQRVAALLDEMERHVVRARKLLADAEAGVVRLRRDA